MTERQILWRVELPLAMPEIIAGLRIATVSARSRSRRWRSSPAAGGLGERRSTARACNGLFQTNIIIAGVLAILMAITFDAGSWFWRPAARLTPWRRVRTI